MLGPAIKDAEKQALAKAKNDTEREILSSLLEGVMPTLKAAELDTAIDLRGPGDKGLYTMVSGIRIKDGAKMEKSFRKTAARFPKMINLDAEKADQVGIHRINPDKNLKSGARRAFGENPMYVAFRDDVMLLGAGEKGLSALKEALAAAPKTGKVMELQMALARLAPLGDNETAADIARKVFARQEGQRSCSHHAGRRQGLDAASVHEGEAARLCESGREGEEAVIFRIAFGERGRVSAPSASLGALTRPRSPISRELHEIPRQIHTPKYIINLASTSAP